jgi:hypothetical protein
LFAECAYSRGDLGGGEAVGSGGKRLDNLADPRLVEIDATAVNEGLKHLVHMPAHLEDHVSAVFDLIVGVLITEPAALLLV